MKNGANMSIQSSTTQKKNNPDLKKKHKKKAKTNRPVARWPGDKSNAVPTRTTFLSKDRTEKGTEAN